MNLIRISGLLQILLILSSCSQLSKVPTETSRKIASVPLTGTFSECIQSKSGGADVLKLSNDRLIDVAALFSVGKEVSNLLNCPLRIYESFEGGRAQSFYYLSFDNGDVCRYQLTNLSTDLTDKHKPVKSVWFSNLECKK